MSLTDPRPRALTLVRPPSPGVRPVAPLPELLAEGHLDRIEEARRGIREIKRVFDDPFPWLYEPLATLMLGASRHSDALVIDGCAELAARVLVLATETVVDDMLFEPDPRLVGATLRAEILAQVRATDVRKSIRYAALADAVGCFAAMHREQVEHLQTSPTEYVEAALHLVATSTWLAVQWRCAP